MMFSLNDNPMPLVLRWQLDPVLIGGLMALAICYALLAGPLRARLAPDAKFPLKRAVLYYLALILLFLSEASPLHDLAERYLFSAHMFQHLLLSYLIPPLLLWGTPSWMLSPLLMNRLLAPVTRVLTKPVVTFFVFNLFFSLWHLPVFYQGALENSALHHFEHVLFLIASLLLWWPIFNPLPELPRLQPGGQLLYLSLMPVAQFVVFGGVTFADHVLYDTYNLNHPVIFNNALADQTLGGAIMKVGGLLAFGIPIVMIFFRWFGSESRPAGSRSQPAVNSQQRSEQRRLSTDN